jgi:D-tyrosyl-tRNA(Tyr) deacylase
MAPHMTDAAQALHSHAMICIVQRVLEARVVVDGKVVGEIGQGMLVLAAVERGDGAQQAEWTAAKLASLRIFRAGEKHFDADIKHIGGAMLLVSNFTVAAATRKGRRPSFDPAADPADAERVFDDLIRCVRAHDIPLQTGVFGADMKLASLNDGPATFIVQSDPP